MTTGRINQVTISERTRARRQESHKAAESRSSRQAFKFVTFCVFHDFTFVRRSTAMLLGMEARRHRAASLATIPVLLTLPIFSAAHKSSRSIGSLKITIHLAPQSCDCYSNSFHASLRLFSKRLI